MAPPLPADTIGYNDTEFQNSDGPRVHGAPTAWVLGDTGSGQTIAIIDTGIFSADPEFAGRISANSTGIAGNSGFEADHDGQPNSLHGTEVAMVAAGAKNDRGTVGIAYGATIMAIRADNPGTCGGRGCIFGDLTEGINWAVDHHTAVINISIGGAAAAPDEIAAVENAAARDVVVVIAAGNSHTPEPDRYPTSIVNDSRYGGNVIIAGAVTSSGSLASFSDQAGDYGDFYLAALGEGVAVDENDSIYDDPNMFDVAGTSFAAPQISGAVALLKQAFPNLTGQQIVQLLLTTAQDVGAPGVDAVYGHGILDIYQAFQPQGRTTLAGNRTAVIPLGATTAVGSPAMGDALTTASLGTIVLDGYDRAYHYDLAGTMRTAAVRRRLQDAIGAPTTSVAIDNGNAMMMFSIDDSRHDLGLGLADRLDLARTDAQAARVLAARVALTLSRNTQLGFAYAEDAQGLVAQLQQQERPAFLIASRAGGDDAMFEQSEGSVAFRRQFGHWGLTASGESGEIYSSVPLQIADALDPERKADRVSSFGLALDRKWGALDGVFGVTMMDEGRTVLGAKFHDAFGGGGARSVFLDAGAGWNFADRWRLGGALRSGWTFADTSSVIASGSVLRTSAWSLDLERSGVFGSDDRLGVRIAQPLRVESGGLALDLPVAYSYATQSPTFAIEHLSLAPTGREVIEEFAWNGPLWGGSASASLFYRQDPGNYAAAPDDGGAVVRWSRAF